MQSKLSIHFLTRLSSWSKKEKWTSTMAYPRLKLSGGLMICLHSALGKKDAWKWTVMIMQPEFITPIMVEEATEEVQRKKKPVSLPLVRFEAFKEGKVAQILHIGPFLDEGPTIEKVHSFIEQSGCHRIGEHHEIYLSDIRRAAPEKWKTIVRQPMS
jgi:hypothetical protein